VIGKTLSWIWPVPIERTEGRSGELEVRWERGKKVLNSAHGNQSFGALHRVWQQTLARLMRTSPPPTSVLMLGLGGGSAIGILRDDLRLEAPITVVELDPVMIRLARAHFALDRFADLQVIPGDAMIQIHAIRQRFDLVLVDLFDDLDLARGVDSRTFLHGLRDRCAENGSLCINTVAYDAASDKRCEVVKNHALKAFLSVQEWRLEEMNRMFIAR